MGYEVEFGSFGEAISKCSRCNKFICECFQENLGEKEEAVTGTEIVGGDSKAEETCLNSSSSPIR